MNLAARHDEPGPMERTCLEIEAIRRSALFRRNRVAGARARVRETDALLDLVEECRLREMPLVPSNLWSAVVHRVGSVDRDARETLGINRDPGRVEDALYAAQEVLLRRAVDARRPALAPIIPLFPERRPRLRRGTRKGA